jgi:hypothetical protein
MFPIRVTCSNPRLSLLGGGIEVKGAWLVVASNAQPSTLTLPLQKGEANGNV